MIYLQIHGLMNWIPLKKQINNIKWSNVLENIAVNGNSIRFSHTHLAHVNNNVKIVNSMDSSNTLVNYQRNIEEIRCMETNSLTKAMMQSSKSGYNKKKVWEKYISRSLELRDKFSIKNMAIVMLSAAKSQVKERSFYEKMSDRIVTKGENYISTYKIDPKRFFTEFSRTEFTAFNIYTMLSACLTASHKDEKLFKVLYKVSEIKLLYFNLYLDKALEAGTDESSSYIVRESGRDDRFTFEDVAGILHAYAASNVVIPSMVLKYSELFRKMYRIANKEEERKAVEMGEVTPKALAIAINSLVKLGDRSEELYKIGKEYLLRTLEELSLKDMIMIFSSVVKLGEPKESKEEVEKLLTLASRIMDRSSGVKIDAESMVNLSSTFVTLAKRKELESEEGERLKSRFNRVFTEASCRLAAEEEVENKVLIQLINNSALLKATGASMALMSNDNLKKVGLTESISDVSQYVTSLAQIYTNTSSKGLKELINEQITMAVRQCGKRLNYVLHPDTMKLAKTRARPSSLYSILKLEAKGVLEAKTDGMNEDWMRLTKEMEEFRPEMVGIVGIMMSAIGKLKQNREFVKFISLSKEYIAKYIKYHWEENEDKALQMEATAAIINGLSKNRIKDEEMMKHLSIKIKKEVDRKMKMGNYEDISHVALFSIINSYAKLGLPQNKFSVRNGKGSRGRRGRGDEHKELFKSISKVLAESDYERVNLQMAVNSMYSLGLVGYDKFGRGTVLRLLNKFMKEYTNEKVKTRKEESAKKREGKHISECVNQISEFGEGQVRGGRELDSQAKIAAMALKLAVEGSCLKGRLFEKCVRRVEKVVFNRNSIYNSSSSNNNNNNKQVCELKEVEERSKKNKNVTMTNKMSGK
ncbi:conserved hypothetical protein [Theileria orientalis strain Shintoku]|uniref:Uncharacterized protein n=1 Tax=Theileria orientalis strain Shintoku TaxID=869250 RepID=J7MEH1_THEOR|nr:conserved hypothetical protein [Theileria orientalis strain Shintoku]BAM38559.1 conserved hypothetical protein [Theileria orientalis strain Shintoku]|eukprot:XP_009688860.1 conserved hypothetical protein [Theileria orientalis strain Shintoku]